MGQNPTLLRVMGRHGRGVTRIAEQKKATPAQVAMAWLLTRKPWTVSIRGTAVGMDCRRVGGQNCSDDGSTRTSFSTQYRTGEESEHKQ